MNKFSSAATINVKNEILEVNDIASKFKGVVPLQNGLWGAEIYINYERIWIGVFRSEHEAAVAYNNVAIKFNNWYDTNSVPHMITNSLNGFACEFLFEKVLTASDVGSRLLLPKQKAKTYFPRIDDGKRANEFEILVTELQLPFFDRSMMQWNFRYTCWKSNDSYVLTKGWKEFVQINKLSSRDKILFSKFEFVDASRVVHHLYKIDVEYHKVEESRVILGNMKKRKFEGDAKDELNFEDAKKAKKRVMLFGVQIG